jgi:hypothetical protein
MTLCLAAICDDSNDIEPLAPSMPDLPGSALFESPKIVLCYDHEKDVEGVGSSETEDKLGFVKNGWPTLIAGTISKANDLVNVYAEYLAEHLAEINEFNLLAHLRKPTHIQKENLAEEYLRQTYAFDRDYFYGKGKRVLPETFISSVTENLARIKLDASLIICGFWQETDFCTNKLSPRPFLAVVDDYADVSSSQEYVRLEYEFAAIGTGSYTALSTLYRREQDSTDSLARTIYNVYEANRLSEQVPGVGKEFLTIDVLYPSGRMVSLTKDGYEYLRKQYGKYGPRAIREKAKFEMNADFFEAFDAAPKWHKGAPSSQSASGVL